MESSANHDHSLSASSVSVAYHCSTVQVERFDGLDDAGWFTMFALNDRLQQKINAND